MSHWISTGKLVRDRLELCDFPIFQKPCLIFEITWVWRRLYSIIRLWGLPESREHAKSWAELMPKRTKH